MVGWSPIARPVEQVAVTLPLSTSAPISNDGLPEALALGSTLVKDSSL